MITTIPKISNPTPPSIMNISTKAIAVDTNIFLLFFISIVNGELEPDQAESPTDACITITYYAIISEAIIAKNNLGVELKPDTAMNSPIKFIISADAPADPTIGSDIALRLDSLSPLAINPSAKSANASI